MFRKCLINHTIQFHSRLSSTHLNVASQIKIPNKIYRDELSVLKALTKCVDLEHGSSIYSLIDETSFYPNELLSRKRLFLSRASGKLIARMNFEEIKQHFVKSTLDEPKVKSLFPLVSVKDIALKVKGENMSIDKGLQLIIHLLKPKEAWQFYEEHKEKQFSESVLQSLLELLCLKMIDDKDGDISPEEKYSLNTESIKWRLDNEAEILFQYLPSKTEHAYNAIIRGASDHQDPERAFELFREFKSKFPDSFPSLKTCNSLIRSIHFKNGSDDEIKDSVMEIFDGMVRFKIHPNVLTFNNAIYAMCNNKKLDFVENLYQEMVALDIKPVLGTYAVLLQCKFPLRYLISMAEDVLLNLEQRLDKIDYEEMQSPDDTTLFSIMMQLFRLSRNADLALRLHRVVSNGGRFHLINSDELRRSYAENLVKMIVINSKDLEIMFKTIRSVNINFCNIQPATLDILLNALKSQEAYKMLPQLFDLINWNNTSIMKNNGLNTMLNVLLESPIYTDSQICSDLVNSFDRLLSITKYFRYTSLKQKNNTVLAIDVLIRLGNWPLVCKYVDFANENKLLGSLILRKLIRESAKRLDFERIISLMTTLVDGLHQGYFKEQDKKALNEFLGFCRDDIKRMFDDHCVPSTEFMQELVRCQQAVNEWNIIDKDDPYSSTSSSSSSDSESDSSSDDESKKLR